MAKKNQEAKVEAANLHLEQPLAPLKAEGVKLNGLGSIIDLDDPSEAETQDALPEVPPEPETQSDDEYQALRAEFKDRGFRLAQRDDVFDIYVGFMLEVAGTTLDGAREFLATQDEE